MTKERFKLIPAVYLVLRQGEHVLVSKRANTGYQDGMYSLVAGHLDGEELATDALIREAKEEANITIQPGDLTLCHIAHRLNRGIPANERMDLFFTCHRWEGEVKNTEPEKCADLRWVDIKNLPSTMLPFVKRVLMDISRGTYYSEYVVEPVD